MTITDVLERLRNRRYLANDEDELQRQLAAVLADEGVPVERELVLPKAGRVDFFLPAWRAALEVKIAGSPAAVLRQLHRYAAEPAIEQLVLVTRRARHGSLPSEIGGKPLHVLVLWEGAL